MADITWGTKVINIYKTDLTLVQSSPTEIYNMDLNWFHLTLKDLEDSEDGIIFPNTHNHNTEVSLGGLTYARVIEIINGYTITFEDAQYAVNIVGGNSNVGDNVNVNQVSVRSNNSAGMISSPEIQYASFNDAVYIDVVNGVSGTAYPAGTPLRPVNNLADAKIIATFRGFDTIVILSDLTIGSTESISNMKIKSENWLVLTIEAGATTDETFFEMLSLYGPLSGGWNVLTNCWVFDVTNFAGWMISGSFNNISLASYNLDSLGQSFFDNIVPMYPDSSSVLTFNTNTAVSFTGINDTYEFKSLTDGSQVSVHFNAGKLIVDASCIGGVITVRGTAELINNSSLGIVDDGLLNKEQLIKSSWDHIYLDTSSLFSGIVFPVGTMNAPVNNLSDALLIAAENSIRKISFIGSITLPTSLTGFDLIGSTASTESIINLNNCDLSRVRFEHCYLSGLMQGDTVEFYECYLKDISNAFGFANRCQIEGNISIANGEIFSSIKTVIESNFTFFDLQEQMCTVSMDIDSGWSQFKNAVGGCLIELNLKGGEVTLDASCTGGIYYLEGIGTLFNDSAMEKLENHLIWDEPVAYHTELGSTGLELAEGGGGGGGATPAEIWDHTLEGTYTAKQVMTIIAAVLAGKTVIVPGLPSEAQVTFRNLTDTNNKVVADMVGGERDTITINV
jgi:hypothetical protein